MTDELTVFVQDLERQEAAPRTVASYQLDLQLFAKWFEQSNGEPFSAKAVTPTDLRLDLAHDQRFTVRCGADGLDLVPTG